MLRTAPVNRHCRHVRRLQGLATGRIAAVRAVGCLFVCLAASGTAAAQSRNVLIIASESLQMPGLSVVVRDTVARIQAPAAGPLNVYAESLERSRFPGDDQRPLALLRQRYSTVRPDLIVALCQPAVDFVSRYRDEAFLRNVPLIYAFVDRRMAEGFRALPVSTGLAFEADWVSLVDTALRLHPHVRRMVVVGGTSEYDRGWQASFRQVASQLEGRVALRYLTDNTVRETLGEVATLPDDSVVIYLTVSRDRDGSVFVPRDVLDMVRRVSRVPVYAPASTYVGRGAAGGKVIDVEGHGAALGRLAASVLGGTPVSSIGPEVTPDLLLFDWRELNRFGISESVLPTGAAVLFREAAWSIHRGWIVAVVSLVVAQTGLIVALALQRRKRTALQRSLDDRLGFGTLLSDVSTALNAVPLRSLDGTVRSVLERIRQYFEVDHVGLIDTSATPSSCRVHAGATAADRAVSAACALADTPFGALKLASFQPLALATVDDLPSSATSERAGLERGGIQSLAMVAMEVGGQILGVLCGLSVTRRTDWTAEQQQQLRTLAEVLASALQRQQTAAAVTASDRLKGAVLSSMAAQIAVLDRSGAIIAVNEAWTAFGRANGVHEEAPISPGINYLDVCRRAVAAGCLDALTPLEGIQAVCDARSGLFEYDYRCEAPGVDRWFQMKVVPLRRPEGGVVVTHRETTEERRHEIALRESEQRFRLLADALPMGVWMSGLDGACVYVNRTWTEWTGRPLERELGGGWMERLHPGDLARVAEAFIGALAARRPFSNEFRLQRRDGQYRWLLNHGRPRYDDTGAFLGFVGGCIDMTDRVEAQSRLRELSGRLIRAQEDERRRIARELHDDLQQRLALLAIELEGMALGRPLAGLDEDWPTQARRLWGRTNEISSELHRISHRLLPLKLETLGLVSTVESYCREVAQLGVRATFTHDGVPPRVPDDVALCVFRVIQEALRNVVKHSGSAEAHVSLSGSDGHLRLVVVDSGRGFDHAAAGVAGGLGLMSMRERLRLVGGELTLRSSPGHGTRIEVRIPADGAASAGLARDASPARHDDMAEARRLTIVEAAPDEASTERR
jgi:PAS domain S-box-containing protein